MGKKVIAAYEQLAQGLGFRFDEEGCILYGTQGSYHVSIYAANDNAPYVLTAAISAKGAENLSKEEIKEFRKAHPAVRSVLQDKTMISMTLKNLPKVEELTETWRDALGGLVQFLQTRGYTDCCQVCGGSDPVPCYVSGKVGHFCQNCYEQLQREQSVRSAGKASKRENIVGGIVGAFLGSVLGAASIVIFGQLGYIAALSGIILAVCTLKGYELLGGKLTTKGIVICAVLMLGMTYFGDRMDWAILAARELEVNVFDAFQAIPMLIEYEAIDIGDYIGNLVMLYIFVAGGAIPAVISTMRSRKIENKLYRLGYAESSREEIVM